MCEKLACPTHFQAGHKNDLYKRKTKRGEAKEKGGSPRNQKKKSYRYILIQFFVLLIITNIDELDLVSSNIAELDGSSFDGPTALQEMIDAI